MWHAQRLERSQLSKHGYKKYQQYKKYQDCEDPSVYMTMKRFSEIGSCTDINERKIAVKLPM